MRKISCAYVVLNTSNRDAFTDPGYFRRNRNSVPMAAIVCRSNT
jgi:hypothetical protein